MYPLLRALLFLLPAEAAHRLGMRVLALFSRFPRACERARARRLPVRDVDLSCELAGLKLAHPIGLAAGLDKDAEAVAGLFALGFAAVEIGTVTPRAQPGNPKPRIFRMPEHQALINRLGFNNHGAQEAAARLRAVTFRPGPVGVNLGKNKDTPIERAVEDYVACVETLAPLGDYVVVNASSPNTPGLRTLQEPEQLAGLLSAVREKLDAVGKKPLFLKIAPDLALEAVDAIVDVALGCRVDGLIATNTTITRPVEHRVTKEAGGFSGAPLGPLSLSVLQRAANRSAGRLALVGVGGIMNGADAYARLRAGASAVQLYTGFIYGGPDTVKRALGELETCLRRDGFRSLREAIGARAR